MSGWYSSESQIRWACRQLIQGREISHATEFEEVKGWRLAAIIHRLIHRYKWPIVKREGTDRVVFYRLGHGVDTDKLQKPRSFKKENTQNPKASD